MVSRITAALAARYKAIQDKEKGFTLIELLVVVIIIGVLAAIAIPVYLGVTNNAKDSAVKSDVANAKTAVIAFQAEKGEFPTAAEFAALDAYGYTVPTDSENYADDADFPTLVVKLDGTAFSICGTSVTEKTFGSSDKSGVAEGTCHATDGTFDPS